MLLFSVLYVDSLVLDEFVPLVVSGNRKGGEEGCVQDIFSGFMTPVQMQSM